MTHQQQLKWNNLWNYEYNPGHGLLQSNRDLDVLRLIQMAVVHAGIVGVLHQSHPIND